MSTVTSLPPPSLPIPETPRWTPLRAGIQDVWEYDDRRFVFSRGRLLLRGQNEAGKTKAMELLFPLLLDADLSPQRLDPFGTTSRPMRWNLINDANPEQQLRIGYVWLEFGRLDGGQPSFCTLGAGLKARRGSHDLDDWFFLTSQRPDQDLALLDETRRPRTRADLEAAIGAAGQVFVRHADYRRAVNARLFGMAEDQYDALVDTLLALRRPQLSKGFDLDQLSTFLSSALPPLDPRVLGPIAEGFEQLDHHRSDLEALAGTLRTVRRFEGLYREYARAVAKGLALALTRADSGYQRARAGARERAAARDALEAGRAELEARLLALDLEERTLADRIRALEGSDEYRAAKDLDLAEQEARAAGERAVAAERRREREAHARVGAAAEASRLEEGARGQAAALGRARDGASRLAGEAALGSLHAAADGLVEQGEASALKAALAAIASEREETLARVRALHADLRRAQEARRRAEERLRQREEEVRAAQAAWRSAGEEADRHLDAWQGAVEAWRAGLTSLPARELPPADDEALLAEPAGLALAAAALAEPVRQRLAGARAEAAALAARCGAEQAAAQAERDLLASAPHPVPPAPPWRPARPAGRPGAPLFLLCDFAPAAAGLAGGQEGGLEAALQASGLLDAWVSPDGELLDPRTEDVLFVAGPPAGPSLADLLVPVEAGGVGRAAAERALRTIGLAAAGEEPAGPCWVSPDGRWRLGPTRGAWAKPAPAFVGETARAEERARLIALLDARLADLSRQHAAATADEARAAEALRTLTAELTSLPSHAPLQEARLRAAVRAEALAEAESQRLESERHAGEAAALATRAGADLDAEAGAHGVAAFARDPERLAVATRAWQRAADALVVAVVELAAGRAALRRATAALEEATRRADGAGDDALRARDEAALAEARAGALRDASGATRATLLESLAAARRGVEAARQARGLATSDKSRLDEQVGSARADLARAEEAVVEAETERQAAAQSFRAHAGAGLLLAAGLPPSTPADDWSYTAALEEARRVDAAVGGGGSPEERERAEDRLLRDAMDLERQLPPGTRVEPTRAGDVLTYAFTMGGLTRPVAEVLAALEADVAARTALLGDKESALLEQFLSGEAHDHLAARLRQARALVDRMNGALEERTTAAGTQVRLDWRTDEADDQADARAAVPLFFTAGHLLSEANRRALRQFLERRLAQARDAAGERPLQERLLAVLDYRRWHRFQVEHREPGQAWRPLTRKAHGAGSGGKKAVLLHLPLFAAAAAFYDSAGPGAPRLVALDEAFAGIDRPTRGRLMGLLAEFELDFVMTSFEEWGFYPELDGLSTYHLSREPGHRGVHAEWFVWNGSERTLVEAS